MWVEKAQGIKLTPPLIPPFFNLARMRVPKMVKNGQNSRLHASAGFDKDSAQRNQEQI